MERGASDILNVSRDGSSTNALIRDFLRKQGDTVVHFSAEASELRGAHRMQRIVLLTDRAVLRVPRTVVDAGIFFDCRTPAESLSQVIVSTAPDGAAEVQVYRHPHDVKAFTLVFPDASVRKTFLLALCVVCPTLPILQRRKAAAAQSASPPRDGAVVPALPIGAIAQSPQPRTPRQQQQQQQLPEAGDDVSDEAFAAARAALHSAILGDDLCTDDTYDVEAAARRPPEEDPSRAAERESVRAMLDHRERKIVQNIEFRLKYPTRVATRVPPGVEYDKAHEERLVLPDDFTDQELLGPSLYPLWREWKASGGLTSAESGWTLYSSADLIESLGTREEMLYGTVGARSLHRLQSMRDLVARERSMYLNRARTPRLTAAAAAADNSTPRRAKVQPFNLSASPSAVAARAKAEERQRAVQEMRALNEDHQKAMHDLRKQQLERELARLQSS